METYYWWLTNCIVFYCGVCRVAVIVTEQSNVNNKSLIKKKNNNNKSI